MLSWSNGSDAKRYALVYGLASNKYIYGSLAIDGGMSTQYTVTMLDPGVKYFFQVWSFCEDGGPATPSTEVSFISP